MPSQITSIPRLPVQASRCFRRSQFSMGSPSRLPLQSSLPLDEDKIQDPVPLIPFSSSFAFAKTPYLRKPFLVVHIHLHNYSDRYTLLQEQAYRILTRIPPETTVTMKLATIYLSVIVFSGRAYVFPCLSIAVVY